MVCLCYVKNYVDLVCVLYDNCKFWIILVVDVVDNDNGLFEFLCV